MTRVSRRDFNAAIRTDFSTFLRKAFEVLHPGTKFEDNWHLHAIAEELRLVAEGETTRLIINLPPRSLKSETVSIAWVAWMLGNHPSTTFLTVSHVEELSSKLGRDCRKLMLSPFYREAFPKTRIEGRDAQHDFETSQGGGRRSTSVLAGVVGFGGDIIIIDDPQKPEGQEHREKREKIVGWVEQSLLTRLNSKKTGAIILLQQRLHQDDLSGRLLATGDWRQLSIAAIAEKDERIPVGHGLVHERKAGEAMHANYEPVEVIERQRAGMRAGDFLAQYQQTPVPDKGNMINPDWIVPYDALPSEMKGAVLVQSWDCAVHDGETNDYNVCVTAMIIGQMVYILDVFRQRIDYPGLRRALIKMAEEYQPKVILVENSANGAPLVADIRSITKPRLPPVVPVKVEGDKLSRVRVHTDRLAAGYVHVPRNARWVPELRSELAAFPHGRHDDQVDALSQLLSWDLRRPGIADEEVGFPILVG